MIGYEERLKKSILNHKSGKHKNPIDDYAYKLKGYKIARECNVRTAIIYGVYSSPDEVEWEELPDKFVIKPQRGCSESGVFPLVYQESKLYVDLLRHEVGTLEDFIAKYREGTRLEKGGHSLGLWIEELIADPIPYDWKFYTFNGEIGIIRQYARTRRPKVTKFWTKNFEEIPDVAKKVRTYQIDNSLPGPIHPSELIAGAKCISKKVKYPFVRVDLYDTCKGVYFGEITPHPGMEILLNNEWDEELGKLWEKAERELNE